MLQVGSYRQANGGIHKHVRTETHGRRAMRGISRLSSLQRLRVHDMVRLDSDREMMDCSDHALTTFPSAGSITRETLPEGCRRL